MMLLSALRAVHFFQPSLLLAVSSDFHLTKEMVMEKPSAQLVGREFVRQYYTLLNQAPDYLHRCVFPQRCPPSVSLPLLEAHDLTPPQPPVSSGSTGRTPPMCTAAWMAMGSRPRLFTASR